MKTKILTCMLLFTLTTVAFAQRPPNKNIGVCGIYNDTISYEQLKCGGITAKDTNQRVTFFVINYRIGGTRSISSAGANTINQEDIDQIIKTKVEKILFEKVSAIEEKDGKRTPVELGWRWIYLK